jgi:hypothetical protein
MAFYAIHLVEDENAPQPPDKIARRQDPDRNGFDQSQMMKYVSRR